MATAKTSWDLDALFASVDDPGIADERKAIETKVLAFAETWKDRTDYLEDPKILRKAFDEYEAMLKPSGTSGKQWYYLWLRSDLDQNDAEVKAALAHAEEFADRMGVATQFFWIRLAKVAPDIQKKLLEAPELEPYRHNLEGCFAESAYTLSEPEERILTLKGSVAYGNWVRMTSALLAKREFETQLEDGSRATQGMESLLTLISSKEKAVRDEAAGHFNELMAEFRDIAEHEINAVLANKKLDDELRSLPRPDLCRHLSDDIESSAIDTLVEVVSGRFDISSRYYALKAKLLGQPRLAYHERNVEYGEIKAQYSFEEGLSLAKKTLGNLDPEFETILTNMTENGQIDVYPKTGKRGGAFCAYHGLGDPVVIMLNYTDKLGDVLTLAHETGHAINFELIKRRQHALYYGTSTATAEVASTFMEDFVLEEVLKGADDELRLAVLMMKLNDDISTIFRQVAAYRFEQELHAEFRAKGYLSADAIGELFRKHMSAYMGESVEQSAGSENWWVYWSHIRTFFYVYSYASGLLISKSLQGSVKKDAAFIGKVKEFFGVGRSLSTANAFLNLDIDISDPSFWQQGLDEVEHLLKETEELASRLGKL